MADFRRDHPAETAELDDSVAVRRPSTGSCTSRLVDDDLPRFEAEFKELPEHQHHPRHRRLPRRAQQAGRADQRARSTTINDSLVGIDYNPGRYIRLETPAHPEHRRSATSVADLRACTDNALGRRRRRAVLRAESSSRSSAIVERFSGREGQTEADRAWTRRVTDVRNWFVFSASERWRDDDAEHETLHRLRRQVRRPEGEARLHDPRRVAGLPVQAGAGAPTAPRPSGSSSSTRRSAAAPTSPPGLRSTCSAGSACSC